MKEYKPQPTIKMQSELKDGSIVDIKISGEAPFDHSVIFPVTKELAIEYGKQLMRTADKSIMFVGDSFIVRKSDITRISYGKLYQVIGVNHRKDEVIEYEFLNDRDQVQHIYPTEFCRIIDGFIEYV